jgi:hypothetical protein
MKRLDRVVMDSFDERPAVVRQVIEAGLNAVGAGNAGNRR